MEILRTFSAQAVCLNANVRVRASWVPEDGLRLPPYYKVRWDSPRSRCANRAGDPPQDSRQASGESSAALFRCEKKPLEKVPPPPPQLSAGHVWSLITKELQQDSFHFFFDQTNDIDDLLKYSGRQAMWSDPCSITSSCFMANLQFKKVFAAHKG